MKIYRHLQLYFRRLLNSVVAAALLFFAALPATAGNTIDLLILYTPGVADHYNGFQQVRFEHLSNVANQIFRNSGVDAKLRIVGSQQVNYSELGDSSTALRELTDGLGGFSEVAALRDKLGADLVLLYRPYDKTHNGCGTAWITGSESGGDFSGNWQRFGYAHAAVNVCADYTTGHEIGHSSGLDHSRAQGSRSGTFRYSLGHGVDGLFTTIMAYQSAYHVDYWSGNSYKFSSPSLDCRGQPCGYDRSDPALGADAVHSLNLSIPQIKNWRPQIIPSDLEEFSEHKLLLLEQAQQLLLDIQSSLATARQQQQQRLQEYQRVEQRYQKELERWWYEAFKERRAYKLLDEATLRYQQDPSSSNRQRQQSAIDAVKLQRQTVIEATALADNILTPLLALTYASEEILLLEQRLEEAKSAALSAEQAYQTTLQQLNESLTNAL